jgi:hypothetical protein
MMNLAAATQERANIEGAQSPNTGQRYGKIWSGANSGSMVRFCVGESDHV